MGYVDDNLMADERVAHRTRLHPIIFVAPALLVILSLLSFGFGAEFRTVATLILLVSLAFLAVRFIRYTASEFAVTDRRVITKA